jgi:hypothetical protein
VLILGTVEGEGGGRRPQPDRRSARSPAGHAHPARRSGADRSPRPSLRLPGLGDGWVSARELLDPDSPALDDLLDTAKQRWRAAPHAAVALAWKCYSYWRRCRRC